MKILYHHRTLGDGAEGIHIREMIRAFRLLGHEVQVVALVGEDSDRRNTRSQPQRRWSQVSRILPGGIYELAELGYNIVGRRMLARAIRDFRPDFVYERYNSYCTAAVDSAKRAGLPLLLEVNAPVAYERAHYDGLALRFTSLAQHYERRICSSADHVFVVSSPLRDFLVTQRGVTADRITVLPNGANPDSFNPNLDEAPIRQRYGLSDRFVLGFVGILRAWHGIELLLQSFSQLQPRERNLHLLLVGDGPMEAELKAQVAQIGLGDHVTFTSRVDHDDVCNHIAAMDVAISPRATFYASPMKILEYMAMGVPVIAPRMANIMDICQDGSDSLLFTPEDASSLKAAMERLIGDQVLARRLGAEARRRVEDRLNWKWNAEAVIERGLGLLASNPTHV